MGNGRHRRKYVKILRDVRIPAWALCYLVNADDSGLDAEDRKLVDEWVERTRNGGRIDVCPTSDGEPHFGWPAFGLQCDVEDCDVVVDMSPWYPQNPCIRFGQSRFGPVKRTALDGKVWWCIFDYFTGEYDYSKFTKRRQALVRLAIELRHGRLPYDPDPGFSKDWLLSRTEQEVRDLVNRREPPWMEARKDR